MCKKIVLHRKNILLHRKKIVLHCKKIVLRLNTLITFRMLFCNTYWNEIHN